MNNRDTLKSEGWAVTLYRLTTSHILEAMSNRIESKRGKYGRKRRQVGQKVRWKDLLIYGPLITLLLGFTLGPFVIEQYTHPSLWNGVILVLAVVFLAVIMWQKFPPKK